MDARQQITNKRVQLCPTQSDKVILPQLVGSMWSFWMSSALVFVEVNTNN